MAKHNKSTKRKIRKRVRHNAKKIKELTAEEILLNPALVESPQFKQLPTEKQIQLMTQVKQIRALMSNRGGGSGGIYQSSNSGDPNAFSRINDLNNKVARQSNENEQLRVALQAANDAYKREVGLKNEIKQKYRERKDDIERDATIADLENQLQHYNAQAEDTQAQILKNQIKKKKEESNMNTLKEKQRQVLQLNAELGTITKATNKRPIPKKTFNEGQKRINSELYKQVIDKQKEDKEILQNQINDYSTNGEYDKANNIEKSLFNSETSTISDVFGDSDNF